MNPISTAKTPLILRVEKSVSISLGATDVSGHPGSSPSPYPCRGVERGRPSGHSPSTQGRSAVSVCLRQTLHQARDVPDVSDRPVRRKCAAGAVQDHQAKRFRSTSVAVALIELPRGSTRETPILPTVEESLG